MGKSSTVAPQVALPLTSPVPARPLLKWVGGKTQLLDQLRPLLPETFGRYFEPFVGGAALFFALRPHQAFLGDVNAELIDCYTAVRDQVESVIVALRGHRYEPEHYYRIRDIEPESLSLADRAARTIFLNKTGFNGLYRVNRAGRFNVPIGRYTKPSFCDEDNLRACSRALQGVDLAVGDFHDVASKPKAGDFVYFDPPYVPLSASSDFTAYIPGGFKWEDQERLAKTFARLAAKGVNVMLSNSAAPAVRELYAGFQIDEVHASRNVNANGAGRGRIAEVVVRSYSNAIQPVKRKRRPSA